MTSEANEFLKERFNLTVIGPFAFRKIEESESINLCQYFEKHIDVEVKQFGLSVDRYGFDFNLGDECIWVLFAVSDF